MADPSCNDRDVPLNEEEILAFVHTELGSVSALDVLLFLKRNPDRKWPLPELVLNLRSSSTAIAQAAARLQAAGFVSKKPDGTVGFEPRTSRHLEMASEIENLSAAKPMTLIKAIAEIPTEKLRNFADAFKFRE